MFEVPPTAHHTHTSDDDLVMSSVQNDVRQILPMGGIGETLP